MNIENPWIDLAEAGVSRDDEVIKDRGVSVRKVVSRFDQPKAVRAHFDQDCARLSIEFKYVSGSEPLRHVRFSPRVTGVCGRNSHRIYSIEINGIELGQNLAVALQEAAQELRDAVADKGLMSLHPIPWRRTTCCFPCPG